MITREQWQRIKAVFHSAQECPPAERAGFLNQACGHDESIRQEVESLLAADETNEAFLGAPAYELMAGVLADEKVEFVAGQEVGPYTILSSLGAGGMGQVYLARDARLGRKVALKLLPFDFARDHGRVRRFEQEARAASALNHPNVCVIHEIGETDNGRHFIAMEYIEGLTLRDRLAQKQMKLLEALDVAAQVAWALEAAHAAGIVHRDIKPENIMLRTDGYVKVLDFGIAKLNERPSKLNDINEASTIDKVQTEPGMRIGTVNYMSPEQLREAAVDARTDIWSLGVVLHEMVTGTTPFGARTTNETIAAILGRQPIEFAPPSNEVPAAFQHIVKRALGKKRRERYQRVKDLADDLRKLRQQIATNAPQEFSSQPMSSRQSAEDSPAPVAVDGERRSTTLERTKVLAVRTAESILSEIKEQPKATAFGGMAAVFAIFFGFISPSVRQKFGQLISNHQSTVAPFQNIRMTPLTNAGQSVCAAISPDGRFVTHAEKKDGMQQVVFTNIATGASSVIVPPLQFAYVGLTFSRDNNYLYFTRRENNETGVLYQVALPASPPRKIKDDVDTSISFSPTGDRFAFVRVNKATREHSLIIVTVDGAEERTLATWRDASNVIVGPTWSPDGHSIVCISAWWDKDARANLIAFDVESGRPETVRGPQWFSIYHIAWLENQSALIVCAKERALSPIQLWRVSYPAGESQRITSDTTNYESVSIARDGTAMISVQTRQEEKLWLAPGGDAQSARSIASMVGRVYGLNWTGNGKIVFSSMVGNNLNLSLIDPDGSNQTELTATARDNFTPATTPDGRFIVFASNRNGSVNIWRINATDGSDPKQLTFTDGNSYPSCSPDGKWVVYDNQANPTVSVFTVWKVPIDGGQAVQVTDKYTRMPMVSPDGEFMACRNLVDERTRGMAIFAFNGGAPVEQLPIPVMDWQRVQWTPDGRALTYIAIDKGVSNIWSYDLGARSSKQLTNFTTELIYAYAWSPDFTQIASLRGSGTRDVIVINNQQ